MEMPGMRTEAVQPNDVGQQRNIGVWRVGSLSMGMTLILIGTALAVSIWKNVEAYEMLLWVAPIVFIMLGAELLLYLKFSSNESMIVKYDWMSVFFVGLIGSASMLLALLMSTGVYDELKSGLHMKQHSVFVEVKKEAVPDQITRIEVQSRGGVEIKETKTNEVHLFGQIHYWSSDKPDDIGKDMMRTQVVGSTMFVMVRSIERKVSGIAAERVEPQLTLVVPEGIEIVERGY